MNQRPVAVGRGMLEQLLGKAVEPRSDVYAFGCVMFELLSGKLPYTASSPNELLEKHLKAAIPSIQVHNPNVSDETTQLIRMAMAKKLEDRPASMWELLRVFRSHRLFKKAPKKTELALPDTGADEDE